MHLISNATIRILVGNVVRQSLRNFDVKKEMIHKENFFFSLSVAVNSRLLPRRYSCSSIPRWAVSVKKGTADKKQYYASSLITKRVGFVFRTKNSDARARGKINGQANRNERDVRTDECTGWIFNLISQTSEMKNASTRQQKNCSAWYWKFANQAKRQFAPHNKTRNFSLFSFQRRAWGQKN